MASPRRRGAWRTVEAAEEAAAAAFGAAWRKLDALMAEVEAGDRLREVRDGLRLVARAGRGIRQAATLTRQAHARAVEGVRAFDHLGDYWPPGEGRDLPDLLASALALLERAERATAEAAGEQLPDLLRRRMRSIMRAALRVGIQVRPSDWGYAFIALGIAEPCQSAGAWRRRCIDLSTDLRSVAREQRPASPPPAP